MVKKVAEATGWRADVEAQLHIKKYSFLRERTAVLPRKDQAKRQQAQRHKENNSGALCISLWALCLSASKYACCEKSLIFILLLVLR